ncbi:c-type cytochrome [Glaciecola sp. 1036]|uniref:c-type cytochrome n=1 Tax=Alteromonadaceae TaxID=72275 RepID=UPI003D000C2B
MKFKTGIAVMLAVFGISSVIAQEMTEEDIIERIKPVGQVKVAGAASETASAQPKTGKSIYESACQACHAVGVLGAPKFQNAADWQPRLEKGFDQVWQNAINGIPPGMPAKGTCSSCTDEDIKIAIEYMTEGI